MADMSKEETLQKLFNPKRHKMPSLPVLFIELQKILDNPFCSNRKISDLIRKDQGMVTQIMQLSNSALYGKRQEIRRIDNAITYLGTETLRNMVLQICLVRMFPIDNPAIPDFSAHLFWKHSLACAYYAEQLAMMLRLPKSEDYYLGGLLHDIGKVLLFQFHPDLFEQTILTAIGENLGGTEAEIKVLGIDHADVGSFLAESWKFDPIILKVIANHHRLLPSRMNLATAIVSLSNDFANICGLGMPWDNTQFHDITTLPAWTWVRENQNLMGLEPDKILFELSQHVADFNASVDILLSPPGEPHA
jgi:putative nucleotidyltransferase with HDIG domain